MSLYCPTRPPSAVPSAYAWAPRNVWQLVDVSVYAALRPAAAPLAPLCATPPGQSEAQPGRGAAAPGSCHRKAHGGRADVATGMGSPQAPPAPPTIQHRDIINEGDAPTAPGRHAPAGHEVVRHTPERTWA
ncbi:hypothetical protein L1887_52099 [Cichorium endivia]|nr:hypothetical protein L1887_52099 [Cichorium endivia]